MGVSETHELGTCFAVVRVHPQEQRLNTKPEIAESGDTVIHPNRQLEQLPPYDDETIEVPTLTAEAVDRMLRESGQ